MASGCRRKRFLPETTVGDSFRASTCRHQFTQAHFGIELITPTMLDRLFAGFSAIA
jgi:hypothetical protein